MGSRTLDRVRRDLREPETLHSLRSIQQNPDLLPNRGGIYAWYFDRDLRGVPKRGCHGITGRKLLYVGISPSRANSSGTLRSRVRYHFTGNVSGSTLRTTLACLKERDIRARLRRFGSRGTIRLTRAGEARLTEWMAAHARVCWSVHPRPWEIEKELIRSLSLPLNLQHNESHPFHDDLTDRRWRAMDRAKRLPAIQRR